MAHKLKSRGVRSEISPRALEKWNPAIQAAVESEDNNITIYGIIGYDWWTGEGVTVARIDAALRSIGDRPVNVYINSPGGDMFEGLAIYNRLREHSQPVTTKVIGLAASAASVIAMAGTYREVGVASFLMIHNCWTCLCGDRHFMRSVADEMEEFDMAMADLYSNISGQSVETVTEMMDDETYIRGKRAIELGFATGLLPADEVTERDGQQAQALSTLKAMEQALAKAGLTRSERRSLISQFKTSMPSAAGGGTPSAAPGVMPSADELNLQPLQKINLNIMESNHA